MLDTLSHGFRSTQNVWLCKWGFWTPRTQLITGMIVGLGVTCLPSDVLGAASSS